MFQYSLSPTDDSTVKTLGGGCDYHTYVKAMSYGQGNTYTIFKNAKQCGDPLNLCSSSNTNELGQSGDSSVMKFKGKDIPKNYFCFFTLNDTSFYSTTLGLSVKINDFS